MYSSPFLRLFNEGADIVISIHDVVVERQYLAAIGLIPLIPGRLVAGGRMILRTVNGKILGRFTEPVADALSRARANATWAEQFNELRQLSLVERSDLVEAGILKTGAYDELLKRMQDTNVPVPEGVLRPQAHHDLPYSQRKWFLIHGLDPHDPAHGRWVEGNPRRTDRTPEDDGWQFHQNWTQEFNQAWGGFIGREAGDGAILHVDGITREYSQEQILDFMSQMRIEFPSGGRARTP